MFSTGVIPLGLDPRGHITQPCATVLEAFKHNFPYAGEPSYAIDVRNGYDDTRCPGWHTGHHVDFLNAVLVTQQFPKTLKAVKREFYRQEAKLRSDGQTFSLVVYCRGGTHRGPCLANVFQYLSVAQNSFKSSSSR